MKQVYVFSDWSSASKMKNEKNPALRIEVTLSTKGQVTLTIYNALTDSIEYKFNVDRFEEGVWSISTEEAIEALNQIGFPCKYKKDSPDVSPEIRKMLTNLKELGYYALLRYDRDGIFAVTLESVGADQKYPLTTPLERVAPTADISEICSILELGKTTTIDYLLESSKEVNNE